MTFRPAAPPHLLTVAEYLAIGEIEQGYSELVEGRLFLTPTPSADHHHAASTLGEALREQLPPDTAALPGTDVDLQLAPEDAPGTVRRPDLIVNFREAVRRTHRDGAAVRASEVLVVIEVLSPGPSRTERIHKRADYADAGIPHYWILDLTEPVSLVACHLAGEFGYADAGAVTGRFATATPFPAEIDLDALI